MALHYTEQGKVKTVKGCVVTLSGLDKCIVGQLVRFGYETLGMVVGFTQRDVQVLILKESEKINPGDIVTTTLEPFNMPVGQGYIGRVINVLAEPLDNEPPVKADEIYPIFRESATVLERKPVNRPMETGIKLIDSLIPVGRGQRELILGDKMTGKTTIVTDAILNQKGKDVVCIYCAIGKSASALSKVVELFKGQEAFKYTIIVAATAATPPGQQYLAPYVACTIGDYFMYNKQHVLAIFDDLTKHAWAYRQISLLLGRAPGRGSYPGDIFYLHSRMIERAAQLNDSFGGGSMTFLPVIETLENDLTAYIPTNLVSMTDGQIFVSSMLFNEGFKPAVHIGLSVSRVGSKAQWPIIKKLSGAIRLEYVQHKELQQMMKLQTEVSKEVKRLLKKGEILIAFLKQYKDQPLSTAAQVFCLYAYKHDLLIDLTFEDVDKYKEEVYGYVKRNDSGLIDMIEKEKKLTDEIDAWLKKTLTAYVETLPSYIALMEKEQGAKPQEEQEKPQDEDQAKVEQATDGKDAA